MEKLTLTEFNAAYNTLINKFGAIVESSMEGLELTLSLKPIHIGGMAECVVFNQANMSVTTTCTKSRLMDTAIEAVKRCRATV